MLENEANERQIRAWAFAATIAPLAHASGCGWLSAIVASCVFLPLGIAGMDGWKKMGRILLAIEFVWLIVALSYLVQSIGQYWPTKNEVAIPIMLLLLAGVSCQIRRNAKVGAILLCSMVLLFIPILLCGISDIQVQWLKPQCNKWGWGLIPVLLIPGLSGLWNPSGKRNAQACVGLAVLGTSLALITQGVLSPKICTEGSAPLYTLAQTLHFGGLSRFEAIVSMAVTLGDYAMTSFLVCCGAQIGSRLGLSRGAASWMVILISVVLLFIEIPWSGVMMSFGSVICWMILPMICVKIKSKKDEKSA